MTAGNGERKVHMDSGLVLGGCLRCRQGAGEHIGSRIPSTWPKL